MIYIIPGRALFFMHHLSVNKLNKVKSISGIKKNDLGLSVPYKGQIPIVFKDIAVFVKGRSKNTACGSKLFILKAYFYKYLTYGILIYNVVDGMV